MERASWTVDSLREHLMALIEASDARYDQRFEDLIRSIETTRVEADRAITKAEVATEAHFKTLNNFREMTETRERMMMPRAEYELAHASLEKRMEIALVAIQKQMDDLATCASGRKGESSGSRHGWAMAIAVIAAITALVSMFIHIGQ